MIDFKEQFINFWENNSKYINIPNKEERYKTFIELYSKYRRLSEIEDYIISKNAFFMKKVQLEFYKYLRKISSEIVIPTELERKDLKLTPIERQVCILKNTHGIFTTNDIATSFLISQDTAEHDINAIQNGISFLGTYIKPKIINNSHNAYFYEDTVHPFFLALNKTEAFALTKELPNYLEDLKNSLESEFKMNDVTKINMIMGLINRLQIQLSDQTKKDFGLNITDKDKTLRFISEDDMKKGPEGKAMFLAKRGMHKSHIIVNEIDEYFGIIEFDDKCNTVIKTEDGNIIELKDTDNLAFIDYE